MISANLSRKLVNKARATKALFTAGLERIVVATVKYHGKRLVASVEAADTAADKAFELCQVVEAAALAAQDAAYDAEAHAHLVVEAVRAELSELGLSHA